MDRITELDDRIHAVERGSRIEETVLWDAVMEIRKAINRLEDSHGVTPTSWLVRAGGPRHPDAPENPLWPRQDRTSDR